MSNIILMKDLLAQKERKIKELEFYSRRLADLEEKRAVILAEIVLTSQILALIKKEKITEIKG